MSYKNTPAYRKAMSGLNITAAAAVILSGVAIAPAAQAQESTPSTSTSPQKEKESIKEKCEMWKKDNSDTTENSIFDSKSQKMTVLGLQRIFLDDLKDALFRYSNNEKPLENRPAEILEEYLEKFPEEKKSIDYSINSSGALSYSDKRAWIPMSDNFWLPKDYNIENVSKNNLEKGVFSCDDIVENEDKIFNQIYKAVQMDIIVKSLTREPFHNNPERGNPLPPLHTLALVKDDNGDFSGLEKQNKDGKTTYKGNLELASRSIQYPSDERLFNKTDVNGVTKQYEHEKWLYEKIFDAKKKYEEATGKKHYAEGMGGISLMYRWEFDNSDFDEERTLRPTKATLKDAWMIQDDIYHMILDAEKKAQEGTLTQEELDNLDYFLTRMRNTNTSSHYDNLDSGTLPGTLIMDNSNYINVSPMLSLEEYKKALKKENDRMIEKGFSGFKDFENWNFEEKYEDYKQGFEKVIGSKFVEKYADKMEGNAFSPIDDAPYHKRNYDNFAWAWELAPYLDKEEPKPEPSEEPKPSEDTSTPKTTPNEDGGNKTTPNKTTPTTKPSTPKTTPVEDDGDKTSTPETPSTTPVEDGEEVSTPVQTTPTQPADNPAEQSQPEEDVFTPMSKAPQPQRLNSTPGKTAAAVKGPEVNTGGEVESQSFFAKVFNIFR